MKALYRKINDRTQNSSKYHKKDGTAVREKEKEETRKRLPVLTFETELEKEEAYEEWVGASWD